MSETTVKEFEQACLKHLQGKHNQKRHGWRYTGNAVANARSAMRGQDAAERGEYRKRAGMAEPKKVERVEAKGGIDTSLTKDDLKGFKRGEYEIALQSGGKDKETGYIKGDYAISKVGGLAKVTHVPSGYAVMNFRTNNSLNAAKLLVASLSKNNFTLEMETGSASGRIYPAAKSYNKFLDLMGEITGSRSQFGVEEFYESAAAGMK